MDSATSLRKKTIEGKGVEVHSLVHNTSRVKGRAGAPRKDLINKSLTHMVLHKPNNRLVKA